jgi:hypothetical protein
MTSGPDRLMAQPTSLFGASLQFLTVLERRILLLFLPHEFTQGASYGSISKAYS